MDKKVQLIQVIRTELELRGNGTTEIMRRIEQFWSLDGKLLAENDPCENESCYEECINGK